LVLRHLAVYPWINVLATEEWSNKPSIILVSLDNSNSSVLPLGRLQYNKSFAGCAGTIEFLEEYEPRIDRDSDYEEPKRTRSTYDTFGAYLEVKNNQVKISWVLEPKALEKSIDRASPDIVTNAETPERIRVAVLSDISQLPFASNFSFYHRYIKEDELGTRTSTSPGAKGGVGISARFNTLFGSPVSRKINAFITTSCVLRRRLIPAGCSVEATRHLGSV